MERMYLLKNSWEMLRALSARPRGMRDANLLRIPKGGACPPLLKTYERIKIARLIVAIVLLIPAGLAFSKDFSQSLYQDGIQYYNRKNYSAAIDYLGQVCDLDSSNYEARYYLIYALAAQRRYKEALIQAETLADLKPDEQRYQKLLEQIQSIFSGNKVLATRSVNKPTSYRTSLPRGGAYQTSKVASHTDLEPVAATVASLTLFEQALNALDGQNYASAAILFDRVFEKDKKDSKACHYRGLAAYKQGFYSEAIRFFQRALDMNPDMFDTRFLLGDSHLKLARYKEAEEIFQEVLKMKKEPYAQINLAEAKRALGKVDEAIGIYKEVLEANPNLHDSRIYLAEGLMEKGDLNGAAEEINKVLSAESQNGLARYVKGKVLFAGELYDDAALSLKQALLIAPDNPLFMTFLAQIYLKVNRINEAIEKAGEVLNQDPNNWEARLILAECFLRNRDFQTAQEHLDIAAQSVSGPDITILEARIARKLGDNDKARAAFQTYFSQDNSSPQIFLEFAEFLMEIGDQETAQNIYTEIIDRFPGTHFASAAETKMSGPSGNSGRQGRTPVNSPRATSRTPPRGSKRGEY